MRCRIDWVTLHKKYRLSKKLGLGVAEFCHSEAQISEISQTRSRIKLDWATLFADYPRLPKLAQKAIFPNRLADHLADI